MGTVNTVDRVGVTKFTTAPDRESVHSDMFCDVSRKKE